MECDKEKLTIPKLENGIFTEKVYGFTDVTILKKW